MSMYYVLADGSCVLEEGYIRGDEYFILEVPDWEDPEEYCYLKAQEVNLGASCERKTL